MPKETYNDLIFQLGDLARERLAHKPNTAQSIQRVFRAEEVVEARRRALAELEQQMNEEDAAQRDWEADLAEERAQLSATVKRFKRAVDAIEGRVKELRKKLAACKADVRYGAQNLKREERRLKDLEMTTQDEMKLDVARQNLKKLRLVHLRLQRQIEDLQGDLDRALTPAPGQPGAEGIHAHRRLLELEDETAARKAEFEERMQVIDRAIEEKEKEIAAAVEYLDQALFLLGEECYTNRVADPALAALYPRIDRAG